MTQKWGAHMRILIAEDDFTSRAILAGVLKKDGHEVMETVRIAGQVPGSAGCDANILYERLRAVTAAGSIATRAGNMSVNICIGAASINGNETADEILAAADTALYQAKQSGRNRVVFAP